MDAVHAWIVPYIGEEIVGVAKTFYLHITRWEPVRDGLYLFAAALNRITRGTINNDDNIVRILLDILWNRVVRINDQQLTADYLACAISHGYRRIFDNFMERISGSDITNILEKIKVTIFYEQYWDFYMSVLDRLAASNWWAKLGLGDDLSKAAVTGNFDRLNGSDLLRNHMVIDTALKHYKQGDAYLKSIISQCIRKCDSWRTKIQGLIKIKDFDDDILNAMGGLSQGDVRRIYAHFVIAERYDLAEAVKQRL